MDLKILTFQLEQCLTWFVGAWWENFDSAGGHFRGQVPPMRARRAVLEDRFQICCPQNEGGGVAAVFAVVAAVELAMTALKEYLSLSSVTFQDPLHLTMTL